MGPFKLLDLPALQPLKLSVFRGLWLAWLVANVTMWTHDVAAAWLMTQLTDSAAMVALVQTASTLPVFLLGIPSGAMADIVDRRRWFAGTQAWVFLTAAVLALLSVTDSLNAQTLLVLTCINGVGLAARWPVFAAIVPEVVPKSHLPTATALGGISMNLARVLGPMIAGGLLAASGPTVVFVLNAAMAGIAFWLIWQWKSESHTSALPGERFLGAVRGGLQFVRQSPRMRIVVARVFLYFLQASALLALLPLVARASGGGAGMFTGMMSCMGAGAIGAALSFPRLRERFDRDQFVRYGTISHATLSVLIIAFPIPWIVLPAMALIGASWIATANSFVVSAQLALPNWVRARGMSLYQVALMGGNAVGAGLWGQLAEWSSVPVAVCAAAATGVLVLLSTWRWSVEGDEEDLTPLPPQPVTGIAVEVQPGAGPVMVVIDYIIDPERAGEFAIVMQSTRRARLRQGALSWGLFRDAGVPGRFVEYFVDENWIEHLRRHERFTASDAELRTQRLAFHLRSDPPVVKRYVAETSAAEPSMPF